MSEKPTPIAELTARFAAREPTPEELEVLRADPRKGAQRLADSLQRRAARQRAWAARAAELSAMRRELEHKGFRAVAGMDEAGRGPLAGPVTTACVILPPDWDLPGLDDSKKLSPERRRELAVAIREQARGYAVDCADHEEIDEKNILQATLDSMRRAAAACGPARPDYLLLDAVALKGTGLPFRAVVGGDARVAEIAAASILAKVHRDGLMVEFDARYPGYGFAEHKGYGTEVHMEALARLGPSPIHRRSFAPVTRWVMPTARELERRLHRARSREELREVGLEVRRAAGELTDAELEELRGVYRACDAALPR